MSIKNQATNTELVFKIALDGPSASGKGLIGSMLAQEFSLEYFQSSILYRGLAYLCIEQNIDLSNHKQIMHIASNNIIFDKVRNIDLNTEQVGVIASQIASISEVRNILTKVLQKIVLQTPRIIMEGRDIGTVVLPDANLKIFLSADIEVRAQRRYKQLQLEGKFCMLADILEQLIIRDQRDLNRSCSPLERSNDSFYIDSSRLSPEQVVLKIKEFIYE